MPADQPEPMDGGCVRPKPATASRSPGLLSTPAKTQVEVDYSGADGLRYDFAVLSGRGAALNFGTNNRLDPPPGVKARAVKRHNGWSVYNYDEGSVAFFDFSGPLQTMTNREGKTVKLTYSDANTPASIASKADLLVRVADRRGRQLNCAYDASDRMTLVRTPQGDVLRYAYDESNSTVLPSKQPAANLASVTFADRSKRVY